MKWGGGRRKFNLFLSFQYNQTGQGSQCNQAIMLITTGTSDSNKEVGKQFEKKVVYKLDYANFAITFIDYQTIQLATHAGEALHVPDQG